MNEELLIHRTEQEEHENMASEALPSYVRASKMAKLFSDTEGTSNSHDRYTTVSESSSSKVLADSEEMPYCKSDQAWLREGVTQMKTGYPEMWTPYNGLVYPESSSITCSQNYKRSNCQHRHRSFNGPFPPYEHDRHCRYPYLNSIPFTTSDSIFKKDRDDYQMQPSTVPYEPVQKEIHSRETEETRSRNHEADDDRIDPKISSIGSDRNDATLFQHAILQTPHSMVHPEVHHPNYAYEPSLCQRTLTQQTPQQVPYQHQNIPPPSTHSLAFATHSPPYQAQYHTYLPEKPEQQQGIAIPTRKKTSISHSYNPPQSFCGDASSSSSSSVKSCKNTQPSPKEGHSYSPNFKSASYPMLHISKNKVNHFPADHATNGEYMNWGSYESDGRGLCRLSHYGQSRKLKQLRSKPPSVSSNTIGDRIEGCQTRSQWEAEQRWNRTGLTLVDMSLFKAPHSARTDPEGMMEEVQNSFRSVCKCRGDISLAMRRVLGICKTSDFMDSKNEYSWSTHLGCLQRLLGMLPPRRKGCDYHASTVTNIVSFWFHELIEYGGKIRKDIRG